MRVLHVIPALGGGGAERQLSLLGPALGAAGVELHVAYVRDGEYREPLARGGAALHRLRLRSHRDLRLPQRLYRVVREVRPHLVHTWLPLMDAVGGVIAMTMRVPWVFSERSVAEAYRARSPAMRVRAALARHAAGVVGNSRLGLEQWRWALPAERCYLVPNALPLAELAAAAPIARARLSLDSAGPLIVYAGRFSAEKNIAVLIEALAAVAAEGAVALLCGEGPERATAEAAVRRASLQERVRFAGYRHDLWSILKAADVVVSLSRFEGAPNVVLEAAACGAPLLLSDIPAHRALLDDQAADFVDPSDAPAVANALRRVLADPARARQQAERAQETVGTRAPAAAACALLDAYRSVLELRPGERSGAGAR